MVVAIHALSLNGDGSSVVRKELVIFLGKVVARSNPLTFLTYARFEVKFVVTAMEYLQEERFTDSERKAHGKKGKGLSEDDSEDHQFSRWTVFGAIWRTLLLLSEDPFPDVSARARAVIDGVFNSLVNLPRDVLEELPLTITSNVPEKAPPLQPPPPGNRASGTVAISRSNTNQTPLVRTS